MGMSTSSPKPPFNPAQNHRRQFLWQILLPLLLVTLLVLTSAVLAAVDAAPGNVPTGQWAAISLIWLIAPVIAGLLIFMALTAGFIFLLAKLLRITPVYTRLAHLYVQIFAVRFTVILDRICEPFIRVQSWQAGWRKFWRSFKR